jgi:hypothetical protein
MDCRSLSVCVYYCLRLLRFDCPYGLLLVIVWDWLLIGFETGL